MRIKFYSPVWMLVLVTISVAAHSQDFDLVIENGRVMDPQTGLDAVRSIGIRDGSIVEIQEGSLTGNMVIDATGLIVAPGFIDLHAHGMNDESNRLQVADGVTTALELETGVYPVAPWYEEQEGKFFTNYGASVGHIPTRIKLKHGVDIGGFAIPDTSLNSLSLDAEYAFEPASEEEIADLQLLLREGLEEGALGIGMGIAYTPAASRREIFEIFKTGAEIDAPIFVHIRETDDPEKLRTLNEIISNTAATGASLHVVHVNSVGLDDAPLMVEMIRGARERGLDITTESYPYNAGSTLLQSAYFSDGWETRNGLEYSDIMWAETGERLNADTFVRYRNIGGWVVVFGQKEENIRWLVSQPDVILASDGVPFIDGRAHPRGAGTFSRVLGKYVREENLLSLMDALGKMTILPAQRMESISPSMLRKGRIQIGADADITIFDAETVIDRATFINPAQSSFGIMHVIVNGVPVIQNSILNETRRPGRAIMGEIE